MGIATKKPIEIEFYRWFKNGDHPEDGVAQNYADKYEGALVRYYRNPRVLGGLECKQCGAAMRSHGWIDTLEGGHIVCPGDYIITGFVGEHYPCKPDIFVATYDIKEE